MNSSKLNINIKCCKKTRYLQGKTLFDKTFESLMGNPPWKTDTLRHQLKNILNIKCPPIRPSCLPESPG